MKASTEGSYKTYTMQNEDKIEYESRNWGNIPLDTVYVEGLEKTIIRSCA